MRQTILCLLLLPCTLFAQEKPPEKIARMPPFTLKTAPLNLLNTFQYSADVLVDIPLGKRLALEMGVSFVLDSWAHAGNVGETYKGLKWKPTLKYYLDLGTQDDTYIGLAFKYNHIENERFINLARQGWQYTEQRLVQRQIDTWGLSIKAGSQMYVGKHRYLVVEPFGGMGFRQIRVSPYELPPDAEIVQRWEEFFSFNRQPGLYNTLDIIIGCNVGFALRIRQKT